MLGNIIYNIINYIVNPDQFIMQQYSQFSMIWLKNKYLGINDKISRWIMVNSKVILSFGPFFVSPSFFRRYFSWSVFEMMQLKRPILVDCFWCNIKFIYNKTSF